MLELLEVEGETLPVARGGPPRGGPKRKAAKAKHKTAKLARKSRRKG